MPFPPSIPTTCVSEKVRCTLPMIEIPQELIVNSLVREEENLQHLSSLAHIPK